MTSQELKRALWESADKLRAWMDAAEYKYIVLALIFLKYVSDAFEERRREVKALLADPSFELFFGDDPGEQEAALEDRDYYTFANVFWVPLERSLGGAQGSGEAGTGRDDLDNALVAIEDENPKLKNILDKRFARTSLPRRQARAADRSCLSYGLRRRGDKQRPPRRGVRVLPRAVRRSRGQEGWSVLHSSLVVRMIVEVLAPHKGRIYDPCCGSGGMFVQSEEFVESHGGRDLGMSIYGQESNATTWRLAAMNMVMRGMGFNLGKEPDDSFTHDQHPDLKADYVLANPPFNVSDWWNAKLESDPRWVYGTPPRGNANFA